jgi:amylosucrase
MALYSNGFAHNLKDLRTKIPYLQELGINLVHVMPILKCPQGHSDGGYAISDFRDIDDRVGTIEDLKEISRDLRRRDMLLVLDVVANHTSDEHLWAQLAMRGEQRFQDYFYMFDNREVPDMFEQTMPEIFPETSPGNFTWNEAARKWVMTVFHDYQWDLNYNNPGVLTEMLDIILFWANQGADVVRLDAVAFLWKQIGTTCQNEREAHLILQLLKDCCQVTAPGVLFIAEAIVAPVEVVKYFGEDAIIAKECEIAYNATFMALLWEALATKNSKLLYLGIQSLPDKLERATWLNYARCHDDIGFGFDDNDIRLAGYDPDSHRRFLIDYYTGIFEGSQARGVMFSHNQKTGDARLSGSLASLVGLEAAQKSEDLAEINTAVDRILLLHSLILSFGGIPLLYYGDEVGTTNDCNYLDDAHKAGDSRWIHRPKFDWQKVELRKQQGSVEFAIFNGLKNLIAVRKETQAFADFNNRELIDLGNPHLFAFVRTDVEQPAKRVLVVCNFDSSPQHFDVNLVRNRGFSFFQQLIDLPTGKRPAKYNDQLVLGPFQFYWLTERG